MSSRYEVPGDGGYGADRGGYDRRGRGEWHGSGQWHGSGPWQWHGEGAEAGGRRTLWVEEPARGRRMPDPVRTAAVRAVMIVAVTLTVASVAFFLTLSRSWLAFPMVLTGIAGIVVATWGVLDVWITRQMWNQRNGVVSVPSSTARGRGAARDRAREQTAREHGARGQAARTGHTREQPGGHPGGHQRFGPA
ncbi:hypothetical protein [Streptomyces sp. NPDC090022]|uniref:hypothetical protein n=1 Tax=Streptomyces sp. NPDC090022 TaxID=3365920 RepID=UPI00381094F8